MALYQAYFRKNGGLWNGSPSADPVTNVGGVDLSVLSGDLMFPACQGSGDAGFFMNFGASPFAYGVPSGYTAGWPAVAGGFTTMDPSKVFGSATLSGGNLTVGFPTSAGMAQAIDGYNIGKYYFELKMQHQDLFNNSAGGGVGRDFSAGGDYNFWFSGAFNTGQPNGGGLIVGGHFNTWQASLIALNNTLISNIFQFLQDDVLSVAVFLTGEAAPSGQTWVSIS